MVFLVGLFISVGVFFVFCFGLGKVINNGLERADGPANKWNAPNQIASRGRQCSRIRRWSSSNWPS